LRSDLLLDPDRIGDATDKIIALFHQNPTAVYVAKEPDTWEETWEDARRELSTLFTQGKAAMTTLDLAVLETEEFRTGVRYGVVPMPRLDMAQKDHYSYLDPNVLGVAVNTVVLGRKDRMQMVCAALEAMCYTGHQILRPAYESEILPVTDPLAKESLDIALNNVRSDLVLVYDQSYTRYPQRYLWEAVSNGNNHLAAVLRAAKKNYEKSMTTVCKKFERLADIETYPSEE
jgi:hypothetical protein